MSISSWYYNYLYNSNLLKIDNELYRANVQSDRDASQT